MSAIDFLDALTNRSAFFDCMKKFCTREMRILAFHQIAHKPLHFQRTVQMDLSANQDGGYLSTLPAVLCSRLQNNSKNRSADSDLAKRSSSMEVRRGFGDENRPSHKSNVRPSLELDQRAESEFERARKGVSEMMEF